MELIERSKCCGCGACANICPKSAIKMESDIEGFRYPYIDVLKCVQCGLCKNVCSRKSEKEYSTGEAYAVFNIDKNERNKSSSGGVFILLAKEIIHENGIVYAATFDNKFKVVHRRCVNKCELDKFIGSKYVQSDIEECYGQIVDDLKNQQMVLFVETPCQVKSVNNYLNVRNIDSKNLITVDFICHGVPSPLAWKKYIIQQEKICKGRAISVDFRNKIRGWKKFSMKISFDNGEDYIGTMDDDVYLDAFFRNLTLRPSCFECGQKGQQKSSDLTIADFWGIERECPEFDDDKGCSFVVLNSEKGKNIFQKIQSNISDRKIEFDRGVNYNKGWYYSVEKPKKRDTFMRDLERTEDFNHLVKKYSKKTGVWLLIRKILQR